MVHVELNRLLVGRTFEEAQDAYKSNVTFRIIEEDGQSNEVCFDTKKSRVNVVVKNGIITEVLGMY